MNTETRTDIPASPVTFIPTDELLGNLAAELLGTVSLNELRDSYADEIPYDEMVPRMEEVRKVLAHATRAQALAILAGTTMHYLLLNAIDSISKKGEESGKDR